jgi:hypothetical protein
VKVFHLQMAEVEECRRWNRSVKRTKTLLVEGKMLCVEKRAQRPARTPDPNPTEISRI